MLSDAGHPRLGHTARGSPEHTTSIGIPTYETVSSAAAAMLVLETTGTFGFNAKSNRLCLIGIVLFLGAVCEQFRSVYADCVYDNQRHEENSEVPTGEPCLNCTCNRSVLLCYLRVCPKLPNPPPPGCILLHRHKTCCKELICSDFHDGGNSLEARSDPDGDLDVPSDDQSSYDHACIANGSIYAPGSAMHSSSFCEYCFCLGGKQVCVKPKCLLPIEGCTPVFEDTNCCPVRYNCTHADQSSTEDVTTTVASTSTVAQKKVYLDGCTVDGNHYQEGSKVIGVGHSVCDNCYCLRGILRCEPLSCAPPLLGCAPVVKPGECCATSYNCNGTLKIDSEPNYGLFPIISKEYSKLRKEVQRKSPTKPTKNGDVTAAPFYVLAETFQDSTTKLVYQRSPGTYGTTRYFSGASYHPSSTQKTSNKTAEDNFYLISSSKHKSTTYRPVVRHRTVSGVYHASTNYEFQNNSFKRVYSTTLRSNDRSSTARVRARSTTSPAESKKESSSDYLGFENLNIFSIVDSLLEGKLYGKLDNSSEDIDVKPGNSSDLRVSSTFEYHSTALPSTTESVFEDSSRLPETTEDVTDVSTFAAESTTVVTENEEQSTLMTEGTTTVDDQSIPVTVRSVVKSSDCINNIERILDRDNSPNDTTTVLPADLAEVNKLAEIETDFIPTTDFDVEYSTLKSTLSSSSNVKLRKKAEIGLSKIEAILNITQHKHRDDFDYDYNEPTLPPSLPNLKIIPFVAADALDLKRETPKIPIPVVIDKKIDDGPFEYNTNLFSPPVKTEGGFVPKEPPILDTFYDTVVPVPSLTDEPMETINGNCISDGREVAHGMPVTSDSPCMTCTCFYGNIVCQKPNCPAPRPGCVEAVEQGVNLCCPNYICGEPILPPLETHDIPQEIVTVAEGIIPSDPFKDVIRTEQAPDLQSLIGDMISLKRTTTTPISPASGPETSDTSDETTTSVPADSFNLEDVFKFIFSGGGGKVKEDHRQNSIKNHSGAYLGSEESKPASHSGTIQTNSSDLNNITENDQSQSFNGTTDKSTRNNTKLTVSDVTHLKTEIKNSNTIGVGLLKLAGCNIYGRMYRVGRIISELSGPCLECKCTDVGVQCRPLKC